MICRTWFLSWAMFMFVVAQALSASSPELHKTVQSEFATHDSMQNSDSPTLPHVISIVDHGAIPNSTEANVTNTGVINEIFLTAKANSTILIPAGHFYVIGGIEAVSPEDGLTFLLEGILEFVFDPIHWPIDQGLVASGDSVDEKTDGFMGDDDESIEYKNCITIENTRRFTFTSSSEGTVIGNGEEWWNMVVAGKLKANARPRLIQIDHSRNLHLSHVHVINCPSWCIRVSSIDAEISHVQVTIDRHYQSKMRELLATKTKGMGRERDMTKSMVLQPEDLNTDGIDVSGKNIWVHHCKIVNDDDSIAVKPTARNATIIDDEVINCTEHVLVEHVELTGFGATVGSVGPSEKRPCSNDIIFRDVTMQDSGKGIYIKSDKSDCTGNVSSQITNVIYQDVKIIRPRWYAIWIGPQQQHEPFTTLGGDCSLAYPIRKLCPTQGCTDFRNISLRNVHIQDPFLSPGVLMGNETNPMVIEFDNVTVTSSSGKVPTWPFDGYDVQNVIGVCKDTCSPMPDSFVQMD